MSKLTLTKTTSAIFLAIVLVTGTITSLSFPSFIIKGMEAQAQPYYGSDRMDNSYKSQYQPSYKPDYKPQYSSYGKDNRDKSNDIKNVDINQFKCINTNININGNNTGDINIGNKGTAEGSLGAYSSSDSGYGGGEGYYYDGQNYKKDKGFECKINNNNNNTNIGAGDGNQTIPPEPKPAKLNVTKLVTCEDKTVDGVIPAVPIDRCATLEQLITENQFNITVTDTNVNPSEFTGSENGTLVTLGAGSYTVTEEPDSDSIAADIAILRNLFGFSYNITGPFPSFTGDCTQTGAASFSATGDIAAGGQETCNILNNFEITRTSTFTGGSSITTQGTVGSPELTASEKITKLKQQWLDLLP